MPIPAFVPELSVECAAMRAGVAVSLAITLFAMLPVEEEGAFQLVEVVSVLVSEVVELVDVVLELDVAELVELVADMVLELEVVELLELLVLVCGRPFWSHSGAMQNQARSVTASTGTV
jgi:hypothetical protein